MDLKYFQKHQNISIPKPVNMNPPQRLKCDCQIFVGIVHVKLLDVAPLELICLPFLLSTEISSLRDYHFCELNGKPSFSTPFVSEFLIYIGLIHAYDKFWVSSIGAQPL